MADQIQTYEPLPLGSPAPPPEEAAAERAQGLDTILGILRRRWRGLVLVWALISVPSTAYIMTSIEPKYVATSIIQVEPVQQTILYPDEKSQPMLFYDTYLNTQAQLISSQQVLSAALADERLRGLPLLKERDPLMALRMQLKVATVERSHLLNTELTQDKPEDAVKISRAILDAYMAQVVGAEAADERRKLEILEKELEDLTRIREQLSSEIRRLAEASSAANDSWFEVKQKGIEKNTLDTKQQLEATELQISQLEERLRQLDESPAASLTSEDMSAQREQAIENDAAVRWVRQERDNAAAKYARLRANMPEERREVVDAKSNHERLQAQLDQERARAAADVDREFSARHHMRVGQERAKLREQLAVLNRTRDFLKARYDELTDKGMEIGRQALAIQALRERNEHVKKEHERVRERINQVQIESRRPTRISIASMPEIRPDGIKDRRRKLSLVAILGGFIIAALLAALRDHRDARLYEAGQVEGHVGLPLLGAVPSLEELKDGRITREDFLESYRVIRATLSGMHSDNQPPRSILVTSALAAEGKTSLAVSLAFSLAEPGTRVLLVDGDVQAPQIARLLRITPSSDLKSVLSGERKLSEAVLKSTVSGVDVLPARVNGHPLGGVVHTATAGGLIRQALQEYDHIVIDSPPALGAADALSWAQAVDSVIMTTLIGHSDTAAIRLACQRLRTVGARLSGLVIANVSVNERYYSTSVSYREEAPASRHSPPARTPPVIHLPEPVDARTKA